MALTIVLTEEIHPDGRQLLESQATVRVADGTDEASVERAARDADGIVVRARSRIGRSFFERCPRVRVVGRWGVGVDNVDVAAAADHGVVVVNTPGANSQSVAEHALAMTMALARQVPTQDQAVRAGDWSNRDVIAGCELAGKTLGVVGLGEIGLLFARMCRRGLGMRVCYTDPARAVNDDAGLDAAHVALPELLAMSDVVSVHVPLSSATRHLIGAAELAAMKPTAFLLNLARGGVVDEDALAAALHAGTLGGAALDVFATEPPPPDAPILRAPRALLSPHTAALTEDASRRTSLTVAADVLGVLAGQPPRHPVLSRPKEPSLP